jgi:tRNA A-37 threonylcarbamoyl transferase component Bud32
VLACLGGGEVTQTYKVRDVISDRVLALKIVREDAPEGPGFRLSREFYYLSRFSHPNIVNVYEFGTAPDGRPYFTMEFFEGLPINAFFAKGFHSDLIGVTLQLLRALDRIHAQGLIHSDLKPANVLVAERGGSPQARLLDFGLAERLSFCDAAEPRGTLGYVAPEVLMGVGADARADLYSLGMVLYEVMTRRGPGQEKNIRNWLRMQCYYDFKPPREYDGSIPEAFEALVMSLIRKEPIRRPRSAASAIEALSGPGDRSAANTKPQGYLMALDFVGRSRELADLKAMLADASAGRPRAACITGECGVGKSRLLSEFKFMAQLEGAVVLDEGFPGPSSLVAAVRGLRELSLSRRARHGLVLMVDDFQLKDSTSFEPLRHLILNLSNERLMVLVAGDRESRFLELIAELGRAARFHQIALPPMGQSEVARLLASLVGEITESEVLSEWLMKTTGGNPLFVIETVRHLVETRVLSAREDGWAISADALNAYRPPASTADVVRQRLDRLALDELAMLKVGAATNGRFTLGLLRSVLGQDESRLFNATTKLKSLGLLRSLSDDHDASFALSSRVLEAAVAERMSPEERREYHDRVEHALELLYPDKEG